MTETEKHHRPIRSYVLRQGRLTLGQERAFEQLWPKYGIDFDGQPLVQEELFPSQQPLFLEVGFGNGESLAQMASEAPQKNFIGIEVHSPGVGHLLIRAQELELTNLRIIRHDAMQVLEKGLAENALDGFLLYFPDPWHKKRHHKRRIFRPVVVERLAQLIKSGGTLHTATDWQNYAESMVAMMANFEDDFENVAGAGNFSPRPEYRPITKFERRGEGLGHGVWDLIFRRR